VGEGEPLKLGRGAEPPFHPVDVVVKVFWVGVGETTVVDLQGVMVADIDVV